MADVVRARAPGKILLTGEYAVLEGAPALVCAVDRHVRVEIRQADEATISAHPLGVERRPFAIRDGAFAGPADLARALGSSARFLPLAVAALALDDDALGRAEIRIDSSELFASGPDGVSTKLGLGSSAAVAAALAVALSSVTGAGEIEDSGPDALLARWLPVYREAMGARASGADLAAAVSGGLVEYRDGEDTGPSASTPIVPSAMPSTLHISATTVIGSLCGYS